MKMYRVVPQIVELLSYEILIVYEHKRSKILL